MATMLKLRLVIKLGKSLSRPLSRNFEKVVLERQCLRLPVAASSPVQCFSSQTIIQTTENHNIINDTEKVTGEQIKHDFQSETQMLLQIVAKSLYSDKKVFIRELISNASDALEKLRYIQLTNRQLEETVRDKKLEIHIATNKQDRILIIQDTGIGMTREELILNLGTIAQSGSKTFLEEIKEKQGGDTSGIIGQFGVGFYSAFMVANKVEVFTKSYLKDAEGLCWSSDGAGSYNISTAEGVQLGTKIVLHLKPECREFSDENKINYIIKKYSNFVSSPIYVNGQRVNTIQALWMLDSKDITPLQHVEFYRFIGNCFDSPRFILHYKTDVPLSIRALLYVPDSKPGIFDITKDISSSVSLYSRKILIANKAEHILPVWLRFIKGVVDSEDIPLNLSRELLQNTSLIDKLRNVLTMRILKFFNEQARKLPEDYNQFYKDYGIFLKEELCKLLRFESSLRPPGELVSIPDYCERMSKIQKCIYYLAAPSRTLAEQSPYYDTMKTNGVEVLFCYESYDELVLMHLKEYKSYALTSVEKEMRKKSDSKDCDINKTEINDLISYMRTILTKKVHDIKTTKHLDSHPCVITVKDMASARHFVRTNSYEIDEEMRYSVLQPRLEINPNHPLIQKLCQLIKTESKLADLLIKQLFNNSMVGAGLIEDSRILLAPMNELLTVALEKY
ncbi:TNF receptor associated protein 1 isoform X2 [Ptiloglossa arizonensis]|uniref:TNF receptor associated protein 1 isoform X2 n=1 Tax=Ptiloglossa arizonensis TaxID=3350558 RepID=UPI003FA16F63